MKFIKNRELMGEQAEYILNGDDCESCGDHIGEGSGFPRKCSGCEEVPQTGILKYEEIQTLSDEGYHIKQFTDHHFRINGTVDIWPSKNKYHVRATNERGKYRAIEEVIANHLADKPEQPNFMTEEDYYRQLRAEYAGMAMQGLLSNPNFQHIDDSDFDATARDAHKLADAMIQYLKDDRQEDK